MPLVIAACLAGAALSVLVVPAVPSYDPWAWLLWGREITHLELSTAEGPAFKPLPVAVCALLTPLGGLAPEAWVVLARAGALAAIALAGVVAWRLADRARWAAAAAAATGVALAGGFAGLSATGTSEGLLLALALGAAIAPPRLRLALAAACGLLRVETWPFLALLAAWHWRTRPQDRPLLVAGAVAIPALWFVPEWLGSGDPLRSGSRARIPNPGHPALAAFPAWESLQRAAGLALLPVALGVVMLRRGRALALAAAGAGWVGLVALMAQAGFSGEERYALAGVQVASVAGAVGLTRLTYHRLALLVVAAAALPRIADLPGLRDRLGYQARLVADLERAVELSEVCGPPYVGHLRGPLLAYHLDVEKHRVGFEPRPPGVVFVSRRIADRPPDPAVPRGYSAVARTGTWRVYATCGLRDASS